MKKNTVFRIITYIKKKTPLILISLIMSAVSVFCMLRIPFLVGMAVDAMTETEGCLPRWVELIPILAEMGISVTGAVFCQWFSGRLNIRVSSLVVGEMRTDAFSKLKRLSLSTLDKLGIGDTVSRIMNDTSSFSEGLLLGFSQFFSGIFMIGCTIFLMLRINLLTGGVVIVLTPLSLLVAGFIAKKTHSMFSQRAIITGEQTAFIEEMISSQKTIKAFQHEKENENRFEEINRRLETSTRSAVFFSSITNPSTRFVNNLVYAAIALVGAFTVINEGLTIGGLSTFLSYATQYTRPFNDISTVITELQNAIACAERFFELLDFPEESEKPGSLPFPVSGDIDLDNLSFRYEETKPLIENFNLAVQKGMKVAIVGPTGCGKTTLIHLLMRFYDPQEGTIYFDETDTREVTRKSLRQNIGMILQDTWIKTASVKENISFGLTDVSEEKLIQAATLSHAHSFIKKLPFGYETVITDNEELSQGQKQLLCITRLMLRKPPVLILDEATSSIDTRTEQQIQGAFALLMEGKTSFIVAHRLSTIVNADLIIAMDHGKAVEMGTHSELMKINGFYANLYNSQFGKYQ